MPAAHRAGHVVRGWFAASPCAAFPPCPRPVWQDLTLPVRRAPTDLLRDGFDSLEWDAKARMPAQAIVDEVRSCISKAPVLPARCLWELG